MKTFNITWLEEVEYGIQVKARNKNEAMKKMNEEICHERSSLHELGSEVVEDSVWCDEVEK